MLTDKVDKYWVFPSRLALISDQRATLVQYPPKLVGICRMKQAGIDGYSRHLVGSQVTYRFQLCNKIMPASYLLEGSMENVYRIRLVYKIPGWDHVHQVPWIHGNEAQRRVPIGFIIMGFSIMCFNYLSWHISGPSQARSRG